MPGVHLVGSGLGVVQEDESDATRSTLITDIRRLEVFAALASSRAFEEPPEGVAAAARAGISMPLRSN
jgi:hypothetical protein